MKACIERIIGPNPTLSVKYSSSQVLQKKKRDAADGNLFSMFIAVAAAAAADDTDAADFYGGRLNLRRM